MNILGINAFHGDSSAALVQDGQLVAAVEEERFTRVKHWAGFPQHSIRYCLAAGGVQVSDIDHVAVSFNPRAHFMRRAAFAARRMLSGGSADVLQRLRRIGAGATLREQLASCVEGAPISVRAEIHHVEHHDAHIASCFHLSPFERAAILSIDGMGDFVSTVFARGRDTHAETLSRIYFPHSLGFLYNAITLYLGFPAYGDEYKVMGLAPYGKPEHLDQFRKIITTTPDGFALNLEYFTHHRDGIAMSWKDSEPRVGSFHSKKLEQLLGPALPPRSEVTAREENIAASLQARTEEVILHLTELLHRKAPEDALCLAGGVAMNAVANGKLHRSSPFKKLFVPIGAADNGTAFGAAFHVLHEVLKQPRRFELRHSYWGTEWSDAEYQAAIERHGLVGVRMEGAALLEAVVDRICSGKVVGWMQGRMEFGARALGNRSLLADPRRADMRDIINLRIKFRERFRPFAPSVLEEHASEYFEHFVAAPFMERVLTIRPEKRAEIPAVTHVDGTGRLQTVSRDRNPLYWELIHCFYRRTGVPMLLNTSLNENEPIVNLPDQAIACFLRTKMDSLVVGPFLIDRPEERS